MTKLSLATGPFALLLALNAIAASDSPEALRNWPQWRGPLANGVAPEADPPLEWSETKNVKWKVKIPGAGSSTPIVWGNQIFILTAVATGQKTEAKPAESSAPAPAAPPPEGERRRGPDVPQSRPRNFNLSFCAWTARTARRFGGKWRVKPSRTKDIIQTTVMLPRRRLPTASFSSRISVPGGSTLTT